MSTESSERSTPKRVSPAIRSAKVDISSETSMGPRSTRRETASSGSTELWTAVRSYNGLGQRTSVTYPASGPVLSFDYDGRRVTVR